jgi:hypothetical protein
VLEHGLPSGVAQLAASIDQAQQLIDSSASTPEQLLRAGLVEQLGTRALAAAPPVVRRSVLARLTALAAASMRLNLDAAAALGRLGSAPRSFPRWRIAAAPAPEVLLGYFRQGQARYRVPWQDLAAIEFVETRFGRVQGRSSAGAEGPMQFIPSTWARYGSGSIEDQRDAILAAARYLAASGAPTDMADALYHYNNSLEYVRAVRDYANEMRSDYRAFFGYYYWQVIYTRRSGAAILPVGYPGAHPVPLPAAGAVAGPLAELKAVVEGNRRRSQPRRPPRPGPVVGGPVRPVASRRR